MASWRGPRKGAGRKRESTNTDEKCLTLNFGSLKTSIITGLSSNTLGVMMKFSSGPQPGTMTRYKVLVQKKNMYVRHSDSYGSDLPPTLELVNQCFCYQ